MLCAEIASGSRLMSQQFRRSSAADAQRTCAGMSGYRKCLFLGRYLAQLVAERRFTEQKKTGARIKAALEEDSIDMTDIGSLNIDTLGRYRHERCTWNP